MYKKGKIKGNLRRDDHWRTLLTDTSPAEIPIIVSNDGFYKNISNLSDYSVKFHRLIETLFPKGMNHTIPYRYNIVKDSASYRELSLLHPVSQLKIADFYKEFDQLITYYASNSPFSIRYPEKIGSAYYFSSLYSDKNKYKNNTVDTTEIEKIVRNPASYFAYGGYDRLYRFFSSTDFIRLEKKYSSMMTLDVSKCFHSIYTHSISWALKDIKIAKEHRDEQSTFGNRFDRLMQSANYNETNGICIGPEVSRIFSELIFSRIDQDVEAQLNSLNIRHMVDYECKRYVDNFYVFSNSDDVLNTAHRVISLCLATYKLHLNESKTETIRRPIHTEKSQVINNANKNINAFIDKVIEEKLVDNQNIYVPKWIRNSSRLVRYFIRESKDTCFKSPKGFESIANYVVSAFSNRVIALVENYKDGGSETEKILNNYPKAILLFIELMFFFFSMYPSCSSSLRLSRALVQSGSFFRDHAPERLENLREHALRWTDQLLSAPAFIPLLNRKEFVPVELLNILVSLRELSPNGRFERPLIEKATSLVNQNGYFDIVCRLFIFGSDTDFDDLRGDILKTVSDYLLSRDKLTQNSHDVHLLIDILSCPHFPAKDREDLLRNLWPELRKHGNVLPDLNAVSIRKLVQEFEASPWFVNWQKINLLNMIKKKELSSVY